MTYVNIFLRNKDIPNDLINKINKFLSYNWDMKKQIKIEEKELMSLLNEDLKDKITIYLNGQILYRIAALSNFKLDFLSQLTFILIKKSYSLNDSLVFEKDLGDELFYIVQGQVGLIHKQSFTYITDLEKENCFGEIGFFTESPRTCTVKSRDFTDVLTLKRSSFLECASQFPDAIVSQCMINYQETFYTIHDRCSI